MSTDSVPSTRAHCQGLHARTMRISQKLLQLRIVKHRFVLGVLALAIPFSLLVVFTIGRFGANQQPASLSSPSVFGPTLTVILGFSILLAAAFVFARSRREDDNSTATSTTRLDAPRSPDVSEGIVKQYELQTRAMAALTELDRAILSRASVDRLVGCVLRNLPRVINCPFAAVILIDRDVPTRAKTILLQIGAPQETHAEPSEISVETTQYLAARPDGCSFDSAGDNAFLDQLVIRGAKKFVLWPVYWEGNVSAVIAAGFTEDSALTTDERTYARDFADRLGVALRASALEEKVRLHAQLELTTALLTRDNFKARLSQEIARARRESRQIALLFVDLDQFKKVNDAIGHAHGDSLLEQAARRLKKCLREEDIVARFGGDEFAILLPAIAKGTDAAVVADKVITELAQPFDFGEKEQNLTASVGACICPDDGKSVDALFRAADIAMYRAKSEGGGQYAFFEKSTLARIRDRANLETELGEALTNDSLKLFYQPQINLATGQIIGAEALIRWIHPRRGFINPDEFIGVAEQCGLIIPIGERVREIACKQYVSWDRDSIAPLRIAVNVSSSEFGNADFIDRFASMMQESGIRPYCLELEITESLFLDSTEHIKDALDWLHQRGIHIVIDDFGTGYSSIAYLKRLPFDTLKLDRAFVKDIGNGDGSDELVLAILGMAKSLGKTVVAEGVETEAQRDFLIRHGCDLAQGFLWSKPLPAEEFEALCRAWPPADQVSAPA
jgi:diguanylate cyclase (GGDEF)-like protein